MKNRIPLLLSTLSLSTFLLAGCAGFSLAADVTPPPDYAPPTPVTTMDLAAILPSEPLDLARGEGVYFEKCAPCHGETGMGDGPQAVSLQITAPSLVEDLAIIKAKPLDWYRVVSEGRMQQMMPPFKSLTPQQIWETLAFTYSMASTPEQLAEVKTVYEGKCASCHGMDGRGGGPAASNLAPKPRDWTDPSSLLEFSQQDLADIIAGGKGPGMPAFSGQLNGEQRLAVAAFIRRFGFITGSSAQQPESSMPAAAVETPSAAIPAAPAPEAAETPAVSTAAIRAAVAMASGEPLPTGLKAVLTGYEAMQPAFEIEKEVFADGSAMWEGLDVLESRVYIVTVEYGGLTFRSDVIHGADLKPGVTTETAVEIFRTTSDASGLTVERMHVFFDFPTEGRIQVVEMFLISNPGQAMVVPAGEGKTIVDFRLPAGYENLQFESGQLGERYLPLEGGFGDTAGIAPGSGSHQVLFAYELPYDKSALVSISVPLNVANAVFMAPADGVTLKAEGLRDEGSRAVQDGTVHMYSASGLAAGSTLEVKVTGRPGQAGLIQTGAPAGLFIGGGVLVLALVGAALWLLRRQEPETEVEEMEESGDEESEDSLLDAILALDDLNKAGKLPKSAYEERRAELKERLRKAREG